MAERKSEKLRQHRIQCMVLLYGLLVLSAIIAASLLYTVVAVGSMLPEVEKRGARSSHVQFLLSVLHRFFSSHAHFCGSIVQGRYSGMFGLEG